MQYVLFEIDNEKFGREFVRAAYKISGEGYRVKNLIGCWRRRINPSYLTEREVYEKYIAPSGCVDKEECVLLLEKDKSGQYLVWSCPPKNLNEKEFLGALKSFNEKPDDEAWTFDPVSGTYWKV